MDYEIIPITPELYEKCGNIWNMERQPQTGKWLAEIQAGNRLAFAYTKGGVFLGEGALVLDTGDPDYTIPGRRVYLSRLIVKESCRGKGIGKILVDYLCKAARSMGCTEVSIGVDRDNTAALHLYRSKGFTHILFEGEDPMGSYYKLLKYL